MLRVSEPARGIVPLLITARMSPVPGAICSRTAAGGGSAIHCDGYRTSKCNVALPALCYEGLGATYGLLILHMLPATVQCTVVNAFKVTVLDSKWKLNPSVIDGLILGKVAGYCN